MHIAKKVAYILVIIGALNWGIFGVFGYDLVNVLFGTFPMLVSIVYVLVGLSGLLLIFTCRKKCSCKNDVCQCNVDVHKTFEETEIK